MCVLDVAHPLESRDVLEMRSATFANDVVLDIYLFKTLLLLFLSRFYA